MDELKIVMFMCNWGPHAAFQQLQDEAADLPAAVRMVRIPCTGRISKSLLFKAFEMGADGVALVGCEAGSCRYGSGTANAANNVEDARGILELLGLGQDRLCWATFLPEQAAEMLAFLNTFKDQIARLGPNPIATAARATAAQPALGNLLRVHNVYACQDCGKCTSACPLSLVGKTFSPRALAGTVIAGTEPTSAAAADVWSCLTCGLCYDRCPSAVDFPAFIRGLRQAGTGDGREPALAHDGFFQSLMRAMATPALSGRHWDWLPDGLQLDPRGKVLFFGGCAPYFDTFFGHHLQVRTRDILVDALRLLNFFDIAPALLEHERCCGHDLLWTGDEANFKRLARLNLEAINDSGAEQVITACPECYRTLAHDYPAHGFKLRPTVRHLFDLLDQEIDKGAVKFAPLHRPATYQDPCRLSRLGGDQLDGVKLPRRLIRRLQLDGFTEMADFGSSSLCCGNCAWTACDSFNKALQMKRLRQARAGGSKLLLTACPKCQIHLSCAMQDPFEGKDVELEMMDLTTAIARTIEWA
ncbi:MAG: methyl-viologen-reducing hydrogenase subunit delta [Syntrophobacteraceae bacterium CG2_30_61_12]|nr:MAG: methyl-viologen-reducing hydrogenase subunit delta [Syntrophobacteraceae bacterium CG2_30_61_12]